MERRKFFSFDMPFLNPNLTHKGDHYSLPTVAASSYPLIGAVALHWGNLEARLNQILSAFVAADNSPDDHGWERRNFTKRKELLKEKSAARFGGPISQEIATILEAAAIYHWQRNLLVHGQTHVYISDGKATAFAKGRVNKRFVKMAIDDTHLERMYHEISFLAGRFKDLIDLPDEKYCRIPSSDISTLQAFLEKHQTTPPKPQTLAPRHPPSRMLRHPLSKRSR